MKNYQIVIFLFFVNICNANSLNYKSFKDSTFTKKELIGKFKTLHYQLTYEKEHSYKSINNAFFIFTELDKNTDLEIGRILITCQVIKNRFKILNINNSIIYGRNYCSEVDDSFSKIATKGLYFTIEQSSNTKFLKEIAHEYITFKYSIENSKYFLDKYSVIIEHIDVDEYPVETLTKQDFGKIELKNFYLGILNTSLGKFPKHIFEKLQLPTYWINKRNGK